MAFPQVQSVTETSFSSAATSHLVNMPTTVGVDQLAILLFTSDNDSSNGNIASAPTGWTELYQDSHSGSPTVLRGSCFVKDLAGTEGGTTVDVVTDGSVAASAHVYVIADWNGSISVGTGLAFSYTTSGSSANPNSPSVSPRGRLDTLYAGRVARR